MARLPLTLVTGRTTAQGKEVHKGKHAAEYTAEITTVQMSRADLVARGVTEG
jgi:formylmethanofuran dehydrogenase subunit D